LSLANEIKDKRDGSSMEKAIIIKNGSQYIIHDEDFYLRRLFRPAKIKWVVLKRTEQVSGEFNCANLRRGSAKVFHLVEIFMPVSQTKGLIFFDISLSYKERCQGLGDKDVPPWYEGYY
jgi:hypothetical protein